MEYQKIANVIDNTLDQPSKFRTKNWVEINDESKKSCNTGSDIKFKTAMVLQWYILVKGTTTIAGVGNDDARKSNERKKGVIFKN